jgi:hypothetical protein
MEKSVIPRSGLKKTSCRHISHHSLETRFEHLLYLKQIGASCFCRFLWRLYCLVKCLKKLSTKTYHRSCVLYNLRCMPNRTFIVGGGDVRQLGKGTKAVKGSSHGWVLCWNLTGTCNVPPLIIGKSKQPHCCRNDCCPLPYIDQKKAWMDKGRYKHWWLNVFLSCIRVFTTEKVALLMDSCSWHDKTITDPLGPLGQVKCLFLSPNTNTNVYLSAAIPWNNCCDQDALQVSFVIRSLFKRVGFG